MRPFDQQVLERLESYALQVIALYSTLPDYPSAGHQVAQVLGKQLLRSGTAVGANFAEATRSHSVADTIAKQQICVKELEETAYWLRLLLKSALVSPSDLAPLLTETGELSALLIASMNTLKKKH